MRQLGILNSAKPSDRWTLGWTADTLFCCNYTPWPVYLRVGDHQAANESSYHVLIPPASAQTIAVQTSVFSASLGVPVGAAFSANDRVDLVWLAGETPPQANQFALLNQVQQIFPYDLTVASPSKVIICDLTSFPFWGFTISPTLADTLILVSVDYSIDGINWIEFTKDIVTATVGVPLVRYYSAIMRYTRLTLLAAAPFGCQGNVVITQLSQQADNYIMHSGFSTISAPFPPVPAQLPYTFDMNASIEFNGVLRGISVRLSNFPLTASRCPPFVCCRVSSIWGPLLGWHVYFASRSNIETARDFSPYEADMPYCLYNPEMTLQTVTYTWICDVHFRQLLDVDIEVQGPDGSGVIALDPTARISATTIVDREV